MDTPQGPAPEAPALVGRDRERAALRDALAAALSGRGSLVLIGGEAGIGKTALAEALLVEAAEQGVLVLVGRCYDLSETPPYGPWIEALARATRGEELTAPPGLAGGGSATGQAGLFAQVRDYLAALAAPQPLVLLLDDLHWADTASLDLLRTLARGLAELPLLLLATYRAEEVADEHALATLLPLLVREARATRLELRPLDATAIGALVAARYALAETERDRLTTYLAARTEGNALFLGELLRTLESEGLLRPGTREAGGDDHWLLGDLAEVPVPALLRQVIIGRVARLDPEIARLLAVAAVIGQVVPFPIWAAVGELAEDALLDHAERALGTGLLTESPDGGEVRFAHALICETLYAGTPALRRRALHRRVAEALSRTPTPDPDAVAYHLQRAGDPRAVEWLVRAGVRAQAAYAWLTAADRYEAALALPPPAGAEPGQRALLLLTLAQLRRYSDAERGLPLTEEAARLAADMGDPVLAAAARFDHGHLLRLAGDGRAGLAEMQAAWSALDGLSPAQRARLPALIVQGVDPREDYHRGVLVYQLAWVGRSAEVLALGAPFAARAPETTPRGLMALGQAYGLQGQPDACLRAWDDARVAFLAAGQHREVGNARLQALDYAILYRADHPAELQRLADEAERAYGRTAGVGPGDALRLAHLPLRWLAGRWPEGRALGREAQEAGPARFHHAQPWLGRLLRDLGEREAAWALVREAVPDGPTLEPGVAAFTLTLLVQQLAVMLALDAGDPPLAHAWLAAHDRWLDWGGAMLGRAEGQLGWAGYHRAAGSAARAWHHATAALAQATEPRQPLALLAAHRLLGELDTAKGSLTEAQAHLEVALALAEACAAPYERALTLLALAELHAAAASPGEAGIALERARAILAPLAAAPALARADALVSRLAIAPPHPAPALPFGLTAREAEVLRLVVAGLTNPQVADRLFITSRTVNAHLTSVYTKLGVAGRAAAIRVALDHDLR